MMAEVCVGGCYGTGVWSIDPGYLAGSIDYYCNCPIGQALYEKEQSSG